MHLTQAFLVLFAALAISGIAAYVSVTGMMAVFPSDPVIVAVIMTSLEFGKIVAVEWLHSNWRNPLVSSIHRLYMCLAVFALMLVTAIGIYGFFSKGYLEQTQPSKEAALHISQLESQIKIKENELIHIDSKVAQLDSTIERALSGKSDLSANRANQIRNQQRVERQTLASSRTEVNRDIKTLSDELVPLKMQNLGVEAKLGPVKYLASLLGLKDESSAVQLVILVLMFAFDPFAISLVISSSISFRTWAQHRTSKAPKEEIAVEPPVDQTPKEPSVPADAEESLAYATYDPPVVYYPKDEPSTLSLISTEVENPVLTKPVKLKPTRKKRKPKESEEPMTASQIAALYLSEQERDKQLPIS